MVSLAIEGVFEVVGNGKEDGDGEASRTIDEWWPGPMINGRHGLRVPSVRINSKMINSERCSEKRVCIILSCLVMFWITALHTLAWESHKIVGDKGDGPC